MNGENLLLERMQRKKQEDNIFRLDFQKKMELEIEVKELVAQAEIAMFSISKAEKALPQELLLVLKQVKNLKKSCQKIHTATEKVLSEYLTLSEKNY